MADETADQQDQPDVTDVLAEQFGEDTAQEFAQYREKKEEWESKLNSKSSELGRKEKELKEKEQEVVNTLAKLQTATQAQPQGNGQQQPQHVLPPQWVQGQLGIQSNDDWNDVPTKADVYRMVEGLAQVGNAQFSRIIGELPEGEQVTLADVYKTASSAEATASDVNEVMGQVLSNATVSQLQEDFEFADSDDIKRAIREAPEGEEFDEYVREAAKRSHEKIESRLTEAEKKSRRKRKKITATTSGRGSAVGGKAPPNPFDSVREWAKRNPAGATEEPI